MAKGRKMEAKKKNVSLRLSQSDVERIRHIADRLGVKESDVLRFTIKQTLVKLAPFQEETYQGVDLMPVLLEVGEEMVRFFDFGTEQLDNIINGDLDDSRRRVDSEDLKLLALSSVNGEYARLKLNSDADIYVEDEASLKQYLLTKYFATKTDSRKPSSSALDAQEKPVGAWTPVIKKGGSGFSLNKRMIPKTA